MTGASVHTGVLGATLQGLLGLEKPPTQMHPDRRMGRQTGLHPRWGERTGGLCGPHGDTQRKPPVIPWARPLHLGCTGSP